ncbi:MAG: hypothetical protein ABIE22_05435 [archaeon]
MSISIHPVDQMNEELVSRIETLLTENSFAEPEAVKVSNLRESQVDYLRGLLEEKGYDVEVAASIVVDNTHVGIHDTTYVAHIRRKE